MSNHSDIRAAIGMPVLMNQNGITVTYVPGTGSSDDVTALFTPDVPTQEQTQQGTTIGSKATLVVLVSDITEPKANDRFTINGEAWSIHAKPMPLGTHAWSCDLIRTNPTEISRPGLRQGYGR